jgi:hypothetical protein
MSKIKKGYVTIFFILLIIFVFYPSSIAEGTVNLRIENMDEPNKRAEELEKRLKRLEPPEPVNIIELPFEAEAKKRYPSQTISISEVIDKGTKIPFSLNLVKNPSTNSRLPC